MSGVKKDERRREPTEVARGAVEIGHREGQRREAGEQRRLVAGCADQPRRR